MTWVLLLAVAALIGLWIHIRRSRRSHREESLWIKSFLNR